MLYGEQVRLLQDEEVLLNDPTTYSESTPVNWTAERTYGLVLSKTQFVLLEATVQIGSLAYGAARIEIDNVTAVSSGELNDETKTIRAVVYLTAGSYSIDFDLSLFETAGGHTISFTLCKVAKFNFPDKTGLNVTDSLEIADDATGTIIDQDITLPALRKLPFGDTKSCALIITACCFGLGGLTERIAQMQDGMAKPTLGKSGFRIYIDDVQQAWTERNNDYGTSTANMEYGKGGYGLLIHEGEVGDTVNIKVKCENNTGGTLTHAVRLKVAACVWWLTPNCEPVSLTRLPFQSTLYLTMEPLWANPTKTLQVGKARIGGFSGCDYYSTTSGADIVNWNYTFETVDPEGIQIFATVAALTNHGACISMVGADIR
jgi:hypothetical protein